MTHDLHGSPPRHLRPQVLHTRVIACVMRDRLDNYLVEKDKAGALAGHIARPAILPRAPEPER